MSHTDNTLPTARPLPALLAHDLVRSYGGRRVLDGVSLTAAPGHRIGLIGENGVGKSTLLRILAGTDEPESGSVVRPADLGVLRQELPWDERATVADVLDDALRAARDVLTELERLADETARAPQDEPGTAELLDAYADLLDRAQQQEVWDADRRAAILLDGLGLGAIAHERALGSLSGGQRARLALAALLAGRPSALLLDEPTNHLDDDAAVFLEEQLRALPGVVVLASHDRAFLDAVCTDLIDLDPAVDGPVRYGGGYTAYLSEKRAERERWERRYAEEQEELVELRRSAAVTAHRVAPDRGMRDNEKMGYGRRANRVAKQVSRRVRNATRRLEELELAQVAAPPVPLRFRPEGLAEEAGAVGAEGAGASDAVGPDADAGPLIALRNVRVPGRLALDRLDVAVRERLLVTGVNGAGKSTLLAVLAGELAADGEVRRRPGLTVGLLAQDTVFERAGRSARATYEDVVGVERAEALPLASLGLLRTAELDKPVGLLSVGQRRRLALALLVARPPQVLLLDEPTNHLSPLLCDELEEAFGSSPGAIVLASHDRWLRARWAGRELRLTASGGAEVPAGGGGVRPCGDT